MDQKRLNELTTKIINMLNDEFKEPKQESGTEIKVNGKVFKPVKLLPSGSRTVGYKFPNNLYIRYWPPTNSWWIRDNGASMCDSSGYYMQFNTAEDAARHLITLKKGPYDFPENWIDEEEDPLKDAKATTYVIKGQGLLSLSTPTNWRCYSYLSGYWIHDYKIYGSAKEAAKALLEYNKVYSTKALSTTAEKPTTEQPDPLENFKTIGYPDGVIVYIGKTDKPRKLMAATCPISKYGLGYLLKNKEFGEFKYNEILFTDTLEEIEAVLRELKVGPGYQPETKSTEVVVDKPVEERVDFGELTKEGNYNIKDGWQLRHVLGPASIRGKWVIGQINKSGLIRTDGEFRSTVYDDWMIFETPEAAAKYVYDNLIKKEAPAKPTEEQVDIGQPNSDGRYIVGDGYHVRKNDFDKTWLIGRCNEEGLVDKDGKFRWCDVDEWISFSTPQEAVKYVREKLLKKETTTETVQAVDQQTNNSDLVEPTVDGIYNLKDGWSIRQLSERIYNGVLPDQVDKWVIGKQYYAGLVHKDGSFKCGSRETRLVFDTPQEAAKYAEENLISKELDRPVPTDIPVTVMNAIDASKKFEDIDIGEKDLCGCYRLDNIWCIMPMVSPPDRWMIGKIRDNGRVLKHDGKFNPGLDFTAKDYLTFDSAQDAAKYIRANLFEKTEQQAVEIIDEPDSTYQVGDLVVEKALFRLGKWVICQGKVGVLMKSGDINFIGVADDFMYFDTREDAIAYLKKNLLTSKEPEKTEAMEQPGVTLPIEMSVDQHHDINGYRVHIVQRGKWFTAFDHQDNSVQERGSVALFKTSEEAFAVLSMLYGGTDHLNPSLRRELSAV